MKKILVPIDLSEQASKNMAFATEMAKRIDAKVYVLHAYYLVNPRTADSSLYEEIPHKTDYEYELRRQMIVLAKPLLAAGISHEFIIQQGSFHDVIQEVFNQHTFDLVVMSTHEPHTIWKELIGNHTSDMLQFTNCPMLVLPFGAEVQIPKRIGFATDYENLVTQKSALQTVKTYTKLFDAELHILHIQKRKEEDLTEIVEFLEKEFENVPHIYHQQQTKKIQEGLMDFVDNQKLDMLVVVPKKHNFLENLMQKSITRTLVLHTHTPLLTVKTTESVSS